MGIGIVLSPSAPTFRFIFSNRKKNRHAFHVYVCVCMLVRVYRPHCVRFAWTNRQIDSACMQVSTVFHCPTHAIVPSSSFVFVHNGSESFHSNRTIPQAKGMGRWCMLMQIPNEISQNHAWPLHWRGITSLQHCCQAIQQHDYHAPYTVHIHSQTISHPYWCITVLERNG